VLHHGAGAFSSAGGHPPEDLNTRADVSLEQEGAGWKIAAVALTAEAKGAGLSKDEFMKLAETPKANCPVSKVLETRLSRSTRPLV
jgi:osmotically inducible protein OsmC